MKGAGRVSVQYGPRRPARDARTLASSGQRSAGGITRHDVTLVRRGLSGNHHPVDFGCHPLDLDGKEPHGFGQCGVLGKQPGKHFGLAGKTGLTLQGQFGEVFPVLRIGDGVDLVPLSLPGLGQQDQRRCVRGLQAEGEVQENERVEAE